MQNIGLKPTGQALSEVYVLAHFTFLVEDRAQLIISSVGRSLYVCTTVALIV